MLNRDPIQRKYLVLLITIGIILAVSIPNAGVFGQEGGDPEGAQTDSSDAFAEVKSESGVFPNQVGATSVLIIQDEQPWGYNSIENVLSNHGIGYEVMASAQLAAKDLSPFEMIVVPSVQTSNFYTTWNANIAKIETYVNSGGKLWISTCNNIDTEPLVPGGVVSASDAETNNIVPNRVNPFMWGTPEVMYGTSANHDSLTNLYPGSHVLAHTQNSQNATVVNYRFGDGQVFASGMTLEHGYNFGRSFRVILINSLTKMLGVNPTRALIIQDQLPWNSSAIQTTLDKLNVGFDEVTSKSMATVDLRPYDTYIIPSAQDTTYYNAWNANYSRFHDQANRGQKLWLSAANYSGSPEPILPGGVTSASDNQNINDVMTPSHPWLRNVPREISGNWVSHDSFSNIVKGSTIVAEARTNDKPTLVDFPYGNGRVLLNGLTLEIGYSLNWDSKPIVENSLRDMLGIPFQTYLPMVAKNLCGTCEKEPNDTEGEANGPLADGVTYTATANDDLDWYFFNWNGVGTVHIDVRGFAPTGQVNLYYDTQSNGRVAFDFDQGSGNYDVDYTGSGDSGQWLIMVFTDNPGNQDYTIKVDIP